MYKFSETIRYRDILFTAIFGHQLKFNADFARSYACVDGLVSMLESLDYQKLREEALDKDVKKYLIDIDGHTDPDTPMISHKCNILFRERPESIMEGMTRLAYQLRDAAIKHHEGGSWDKDQLKHYRWRLTDFLNQIKERLEEFSGLYSDMSVAETPFQRCLVNCDRQAVMEKLNALMNGVKGKGAALVLEACQQKGYLVPHSYTTRMVIEEFGLETSPQSIDNYLNKGRFRRELGVLVESLP